MVYRLIVEKGGGLFILLFWKANPFGYHKTIRIINTSNTTGKKRFGINYELQKYFVTNVLTEFANKKKITKLSTKEERGDEKPVFCFVFVIIIIFFVLIFFLYSA